MPQSREIPQLLRRFPIFAPILAGATLRDRILACIGAAAAIGLTILVSRELIGDSAYVPWIIAPIGASAVVLFAIPGSPLAQPWPIIGGNTVSAFTGLAVIHLIGEPVLATVVGLCLAIAVMSFARCLHPPGGSLAVGAILATPPAISEAGLLYPLVPVALNSLVLVALGTVFHRLSRRTYPSVGQLAEKNAHGTGDPPPAIRAGFKDEDVDAALTELDETFDIDRHDLKRLLRQVQHHALVRSQGDLTCEDIMSRDVIKIRVDEAAETARKLLLLHNIRTLPVIDHEDRLVGTIGLRELAVSVRRIDDLMSPPATAPQTAPAMSLVSLLTDGRTQAVIIVDADRRIIGLITQTDLLSTLARIVPSRELRAA